MGVFTFVCKNGGGAWTAKQHEGELEASASSTYELQRKLVQAALSADSSGGVQSSFSLVSPTSAVFQVYKSLLLDQAYILESLCENQSLHFLMNEIHSH